MKWSDHYDLILNTPERGTLIELDLRRTDADYAGKLTGHLYELTRDGLVGIYRPEDAEQVPLEGFVTFYPVDGIKFRKLPQVTNKS